MMCPECYKYFMDEKKLVEHMLDKEEWTLEKVKKRLLPMGVIHEKTIELFHMKH